MPWHIMDSKSVLWVIGISFHFTMPRVTTTTSATHQNFYHPALSRDPKTRKERAHQAPIRQPNQRLHPRLRTKQPRELPRNMQADIARISDHIPRRRARSSEFRVRSLVPGGLFLKIDLRRAGAGAVVGCRGERIRFPEQSCELAEQRSPAKDRQGLVSAWRGKVGGASVLTMFSH
jgi:hypothetical protein